MTRRTLLRASLALLARPARVSFAQTTPLARGAQPGDHRDVDGVTFCWCPPGRFTMGSPVSEPGRRADEAPVQVSLSRGFWTARTETTQGQWTRIVGAFPDRAPSAEFGIGDDFPLYWVNYAEAETFCRRLTDRARRSGMLTDRWEVRLPTEAQWEYACRAGTTTASAFGASLTTTHANVGDEAAGGRNARVYAGRATPACRYPANPWGICDMHGNVFEWCRDWYHATLPGGIDPDLSGTIGVRNGDGSYSRVRRGGAWNDAPVFCRSAMRLRYEPERRSDHIGFRVVVVEV